MASIFNPKESLPAGASIPSLITTFFCLCTWLCLWYWSVDSVWLSIFPSGGLMLSGAGANLVLGVSPWMYTGFLQIRLCHNIHVCLFQGLAFAIAWSMCWYLQNSVFHIVLNLLWKLPCGGMVQRLGPWSILQDHWKRIDLFYFPWPHTSR